MTSSVRRDHEQSMGYWLNEPAILDHALLVDGMADLAREGYGIVRVMLRQTHFAYRSQEVIAAVRTATEHAHRHGMRLVLDCEPHGKAAREMGSVYPAAVGMRLFRGEGPLRDGGFRVDLRLPSTGGFTFDHVAAAAVDGRSIAVPECSLTWETNMTSGGIADARQDYVDGRPMAPTRHVGLRGRVADAPDGTLALYVAVRDYQLVDFAAPEARRWYRELLDEYRDIPLDGICWDEPGVGGDWNSYRYGRAFARRFAESNGYDLASRLHLLDAPGLASDAVRVRLDYYRALNESLAEAQADLLASARATFGDGILTGTHHTWQGEGGANDYRAGAVDYFRLNDAMDAGYTDCCWWDPASVAYSYALASSLGRLTPTGAAECNTWHWKPTNRSTLYNARLMSLMRITWFNIWYGNDADTAMYPRHYTWKTATESMRRHRRWQVLLGDARPEVELAVLHDWQGVCGTNLLHVANLQKSFCMNFSLRAQERGVAFDFLDARLLASSTVEDGTLVNALGRYRVLVVPHASVIGRASWERVEAFAGAGGRVVFCGPPPSVDATGEDLTAPFAALMSIEPLHADAYDAWFHQAGAPLPQHRPERFDLAYPVPADAARAIASVEGDVHGVRSPGGGAAWFTGYEASEAVLSEVSRLAPAPVACHSATMLWRLYRDQDRALLMLIARENEELSGIVEFAGWSLRLDGGTCACLAVTHDGDAQLHRDEDDPSHAELLQRIQQ